jgi:hypothetical protein
VGLVVLVGLDLGGEAAESDGAAEVGDGTGLERRDALEGLDAADSLLGLGPFDQLIDGDARARGEFDQGTVGLEEVGEELVGFIWLKRGRGGVGR